MGPPADVRRKRVADNGLRSVVRCSKPSSAVAIDPCQAVRNREKFIDAGESRIASDHLPSCRSLGIVGSATVALSGGELLVGHGVPFRA